MDGKGAEIARCLGYRHAFDDDDADDDAEGRVGGDGSDGAAESAGPCDACEDYGGRAAAEGDDDDGARDRVDMWHLRSLAIRPGGLLDGRGRKLGWIKLAGVDDGLVFDGSGVSDRSGSGIGAERAGDDGGCAAYEQIRKRLDGEMEPSGWHIQRERRRLRRGERGRENGDGRRRSEDPTRPSAARAPGSNDASSVGSERSGSSTPLTSNLNSRAGTPKSVSFHGFDDGGGGLPSTPTSAGLGASFMAFPSPSTSTTDTSFDSSTLADASTTVEDDFDNSPPSTKDVPSPLPSSPLVSSPIDRATAPQCRDRPTHRIRLDLTPQSYLHYSRRYQRKRHGNNASAKQRARKDRRPQERKLLVQIAASASYLLRRDARDLRYRPGMQDLIAVLLLNLESPSLTSLLLRRIAEGHLRACCSAAGEEDDGDASFVTCADEIIKNDGSVHGEDVDNGRDDGGAGADDGRKWDALPLAFLPMLQILDEELHASLVSIDGGRGSVGGLALVFAEALREWISSWFCCHDALPLEAASRIVDFFLASHPSMPLYLSLAVLCHPFHRDKLLVLSRQSQESSPESHTSSNKIRDVESTLQPLQLYSKDENVSLANMLGNAFSNLGQELLSKEGFGEDVDIDGVDVEWDNDDDELVRDFMEQAISSAISFMKRIPPQEIYPLLKEYRSGILMPYLTSTERDKVADPLPWTNRSIAPTDYNMIQRMFTDKKVGDMNTCALSRSVAAKHQIALDASGLPTSQLTNQFCTEECRSTSTNRSVMPAKAFIVGVALCVGAQLLQVKQNPPKGKLPFSEDDSMLLGSAVSTRLPPTVVLPKQATAPGALNAARALNEDTADVEPASSSILSLVNGTDNSPEMPTLSNVDTVEKKFLEETHGTLSEQVPSLPLDIPPVTSEDQDESAEEIDGADSKDEGILNAPGPGEECQQLLGCNPEEKPTLSNADTADIFLPEETHGTLSALVSILPLGIPPLASEDQNELAEEINGANSEDDEILSAPGPGEECQHLLGCNPEEKPTLSNVDTADNFFLKETHGNLRAPVSILPLGIPPLTSEDQDELAEEINGADSKDEGILNAPGPGEKCQHLLEYNQEEKKEGRFAPIRRSAKNHAARRRKLSAGIKKRALRSLKRFRDGYVALVENDDLFL